MDYKKLVKALVCNGSNAGEDDLGCTKKRCKYRDCDGACNVVSVCEDAASAITSLLARAEEAEKIADEYAESARAIALWLSGFCNKELSYPSMISDAARKISIAYADMENRAKKAEKERAAAISDLETIMAYGDSALDTCQFCNNSQCYERGGTKPCLPKWRGQKEE